MSIDDQIRLQAGREPAQLESEIVRQRDHISELVQALESKLSPGELLSRVWTQGKGGGHEFANQLGSTVKANPVPALLTFAGIAWLYARSDNRPTSTDMGSAGDHRPMGERVHHAREATSAKLGSAKTRASNGFQHLLEQNPLALGAIGIAAGAALGALIPESQKEHELMGDTSERLKQKLRAEASAMSERTGGAPASGTATAQASAPSQTSAPSVSPPGIGTTPTGDSHSGRRL